MRQLLNILLPLLVGAAVLAFWEWIVAARAIPVYVLPAPSAIVHALADNFSSLMNSLLTTFSVTVEGFFAALITGVAFAILFTRHRLIERTFYPYAVVLQVTPVVSIAPLLLIWLGYDHIDRTLILIAALIAFFPVLANTTLGLKSADFNLIDLMRLYGASRWQILWRLQLPSALPYLLSGMRVSGTLALVGAVTAEMVAGSGTATGLGWRIIESNNRLEIATEFAALALLALLGFCLFYALSGLEYLLLRRWHESALKRPS